MRGDPWSREELLTKINDVACCYRLVYGMLFGRAVRALRIKPGYGSRGCGRGALGRETAAAFGVFVLLLNIISGSLSHSHFDAQGGLALSQDGSKMAICSGARMIFLDREGNIVPGEPGEPQHPQHECVCCLLMQASAVLPPPPPAPAPLEIFAIQILRPGAVQHLHAAAVPAPRNRDPPFQA